MNITSGTNTCQTSSASDTAQLKQAFDLCIRKTRNNIKRLADEPKSASWDVDGNYFNFKEGFYEIGNWTSSFFTGMALLAWRETEDEFFLQQVLRLAPHYREKVFTRFLDTHHDLGFLYSLYSVALYKLTADQQHRTVALRAAELLAQRFHPRGRFIRAWGRVDTAEFSDMAIIDCLMNLPLLYWAAKETGNGKFYDIATQHADTVLKTFIRPDHSVYHAYRFDLETGQPLRGDTYGGYAVESCWARGAAWAIYGFALSYGYTHYARYLDAARQLAKAFAANLDGDAIPLWDFKLPPGKLKLHDASAASVAICGLRELEKYGVNDTNLVKSKRDMLERLTSKAYLNFDLNCPGIQPNGQVGNGKPGGAQNAYTAWGDYFLMEILAKELTPCGGFW